MNLAYNYQHISGGMPFTVSDESAFVFAIIAFIIGIAMASYIIIKLIKG